MTHDEAVKKLEALGFSWAKPSCQTALEPSDSCLTYEPGCCHGWIEIRGAPGLVGEVEMQVDDRDEFTLRFPSLIDLVEHIVVPTVSA